MWSSIQAFQNKASHSVALHQSDVTLHRMSHSVGRRTVLVRHRCIRHRSASDVTRHQTSDVTLHLDIGVGQMLRSVTPSNVAHWSAVCSVPLSQDLESLSGAPEDTAVDTAAQHLRRESNYLQSIVRMHSRVHAHARTYAHNLPSDRVANYSSQ